MQVRIRNSMWSYEFWLGIISTFLLIFQFTIFDISIFKYVAFIFGALILFTNGFKLKFNAKYDFLPFFLFTLISGLIPFIASYTYKEYSLRSCIDFLFLAFLCFSVCSSNSNKIKYFFYGLRISCYIQIIFCFVQIISWYCFNLDINNQIFVKNLNLIDKASFFKDGQYCVSGLSHHPSNLIVVILLSLSLLKSSWKWPICIVISVLSRNLTVMLSIIVYSTLLISYSFSFNSIKKVLLSKISKSYFYVVLIIIAVTILCNNDEIQEIINKNINRVYSICFSNSSDGSNIAHSLYYTKLPEILENFNVVEFLFGYSYGWTGGMFNIFFGQQYNEIFLQAKLNWGVESDPMNILYGSGLIGFTSFYYWIIKTSIKGININKVILPLLFSIIFAGLFYCIQYQYVILIEVLITVSIYRKVNVFNLSKAYQNS